MRFILAMGLSLAFMASFMLSASALTVTNSTKKYATVLGYDYEYDCQAYCDSSNAWAYTNVVCTDGVRPIALDKCFVTVIHKEAPRIVQIRGASSLPDGVLINSSGSAWGPGFCRPGRRKAHCSRGGRASRGPSPAGRRTPPCPPPPCPGRG